MMYLYRFYNYLNTIFPYYPKNPPPTKPCNTENNDMVCNFEYLILSIMIFVVINETFFVDFLFFVILLFLFYCSSYI